MPFMIIILYINFVDINECVSTHGCQQVCINTDGGFRCECRQGFQLNTDGSTCSGTTVELL